MKQRKFGDLSIISNVFLGELCFIHIGSRMFIHKPSPIVHKPMEVVGLPYVGFVVCTQSLTVV